MLNSGGVVVTCVQRDDRRSSSSARRTLCRGAQHKDACDKAHCATSPTVGSNAWCEARSSTDVGVDAVDAVARPRVGRERVPRHEAALGFSGAAAREEAVRVGVAREGDRRRVAGLVYDKRREHWYRREPSEPFGVLRFADHNRGVEAFDDVGELFARSSQSIGATAALMRQAAR